MSISLKRAGRRSACLAVILLVMAVTAHVALAHAKQERSLPKAGSKPDRPPKLIELWFSEELRQGFSSIEVRDKAGRRVDRGEVIHSEGGKKAQVELEELGAGTYAVVWKVLSADEHTIRGRFTFTVTAAATSAATTAVTPEPPAEATPAAQGVVTPAREEVTQAESEDSPIDVIDSAVRWLAYLAMMTLFGGFALRLFVLGHAFSREHAPDAEGAGDGGTGRSLLLMWVAVVVLVVAALLALVFQSAAVFGAPAGEAIAPARLGEIITKTGFGRAWLVGAVAAVTLCVILFFIGRAARRRPAEEHRPLWLAGLAASALLLLSPSLTGHAAASAGQYRLAVLSDWLHLVSGGFWVGGLFHLALALPPALSGLSAERRAHALGGVIPLFTRVAVPAVVLVFLAGLYNSWLHVGGWEALWASAYGRTLLVKLLLVLAMIVLGAVNNFHYGRKVKRLAGGREESAVEGVGRGFSRAVKLEAALGVLILLATAFLVFTTPGRNHTTATTPARAAVTAGTERR